MEIIFEDEVTNYILITGDREWKNSQLIKKALLDTGFEASRTEFIHGGCRGSDLLGAQEAKKLGFTIKEFSADWKKYGLAAGPIRNKQMFDYIKDKKNKIVLVFHDNLAASKGTKSMVNICTKGDKNLKLVYIKNEK